MERLSDLSPATWIREGCVPLPKYTHAADWELRTHHVLPALFESYLKVFHPLFEDPAVLDRRRSWDKVEKSAPPARGEVVRMLTEGATLFSVAPTREQQAQLIPLRWKPLADRLGLAYGPALSDKDLAKRFRRSLPAWLWGPAEGDLGLPAFEAIGERLLAGSQGSPLYALWDLIVDPTEGDVLLGGTFDELRALLRDAEQRSTPTWWWPQDRRWCVGTDWDLTFTLIGGPKAQIEALAEDPRVESLPVDAETVVLRG